MMSREMRRVLRALLACVVACVAAALWAVPALALMPGATLTADPDQGTGTAAPGSTLYVTVSGMDVADIYFGMWIGAGSATPMGDIVPTAGSINHQQLPNPVPVTTGTYTIGACTSTPCDASASPWAVDTVVVAAPPPTPPPPPINTPKPTPKPTPTPK